MEPLQIVHPQSIPSTKRPGAIRPLHTAFPEEKKRPLHKASPPRECFMEGTLFDGMLHAWTLTTPG